MKIFLAGAGGAIGRRLTPLLRSAGHTVFGTTRAADKAEALRALGAEPVVVDVFDAQALARAVEAAPPMSSCISSPISHLRRARLQYEEGLARNARLRIEGTRNLVDAAKAAGVRRMITQSIAFVYAPGDGARDEIDPLDLSAAGARKRTVDGVVALEQATLELPEGIVLRYGYLLRPRHLVRGCQAGEAGVARGCGCGGGAACREQRQARHLQHRGRRRRDLEREGQA